MALVQTWCLSSLLFLVDHTCVGLAGRLGEDTGCWGTCCVGIRRLVLLVGGVEWVDGSMGWWVLVVVSRCHLIFSFSSFDIFEISSLQFPGWCGTEG